MLEMLAIFAVICWGALLGFIVLATIGLIMVMFDFMFDTNIGRRCVRRFIAFMKDEGYYE